MTNIDKLLSPSRYYLHFANGDNKEIDNTRRKFKKKKREKLNNNYDKLFFNFLLIVRANTLTLDYNRNTEIKLKYEFAQKMENMKVKKIETVINNLCYEENINLKTLSALCFLFSKTMFYCSQNVFIMLNENKHCDNTKLYLVKNDSSIICVKEDKKKELQETSFEIKNLDKIFYSMTHYKVENLKEIGTLLGLNIDGKKKDIYEKISQHLTNTTFIKN